MHLLLIPQIVIVILVKTAGVRRLCKATNVIAQMDFRGNTAVKVRNIYTYIQIHEIASELGKAK